jgi:syntaxin 5
VAKRKSLFNDRPAEIQELTYIIKEDLNSLNQQIAKLQEVARNQRQSQQNGHHLLSHSSSVVLALQSKLASMSTEFKQVLEVRTEVCAYTSWNFTILRYIRSVEGLDLMQNIDLNKMLGG